MTGQSPEIFFSVGLFALASALRHSFFFFFFLKQTQKTRAQAFSRRHLTIHVINLRLAAAIINLVKKVTKRPQNPKPRFYFNKHQELRSNVAKQLGRLIQDNSENTADQSLFERDVAGRLECQGWVVVHLEQPRVEVGIEEDIYRHRTQDQKKN